MPWKISLTLVALLACGTSCRQSQSPEITVAAAANLTEVFQKLGPVFERRTGIHPVFSFASTAQLARQIENGAPFDVIAAADAEHVESLDRKGLLLPGSRRVYAIGVLALWSPPDRKKTVANIEDLLAPEVKVIAAAKPELAPYGQATLETLQHSGVWDRVEPKIVYAENIRMAKQYGATGNADAVFTAYSLVVHERGTVIQIDEKMHAPLMQEMGIIANSQRLGAAKKFTDFLAGPEGRAVFGIYGYRMPAAR